MAKSEIDELRREVAELRRLVDELREPKPARKTTSMNLESLTTQQLRVVDDEGQVRARIGLGSCDGGKEHSGKVHFEMFGTDGMCEVRLGPSPSGGYGLTVCRGQTRKDGQARASVVGVEVGITSPSPADTPPEPGVMVQGKNQHNAFLGLDRKGRPRLEIHKRLTGQNQARIELGLLDDDKEETHGIVVSDKLGDGQVRVAVGKAGRIDLQIGNRELTSGVKIEYRDGRPAVSIRGEPATAGEQGQMIHLAIEKLPKQPERLVVRVVEGDGTQHSIYPAATAGARAERKA